MPPISLGGEVLEIARELVAQLVLELVLAEERAQEVEEPRHG
jgi:hypothetical protein